MNIEETDIFSLPEDMGIEPFVAADVSNIAESPTPISASVDSDPVDEAEKNVKHIFEKGKLAINNLYNIASMSDDPRVYRVLSEMITSVAAVNRDLFEIEKIKNAKKIVSSNPNGGPTINNNALIVGTTADINKILESLNFKTKPIIEFDEPDLNYNAGIEDP